MFKKRKILFISVMLVIFSISTFTLSGCSKTEDNFKYVNEEYGFSKGSYFGTEIEMVDNKNKVVANYIEISNKDGELEGYIINDYVTEEVYEYALGGSVLFDLIEKSNLDTEIVKKNPVYYAGPFNIIVTDDEGNLYNLMSSEDNVGELISKEDLDIIFNDKDNIYQKWDYRPMISKQGFVYGETGKTINTLPEGFILLGKIENKVSETEPMVKRKDYFVSNSLPIETNVYGHEQLKEVIYADFNGSFIKYELIEK